MVQTSIEQLEELVKCDIVITRNKNYVESIKIIMHGTIILAEDLDIYQMVRV
jgi:hypothetical protein